MNQNDFNSHIFHKQKLLRACTFILLFRTTFTTEKGRIINFDTILYFSILTTKKW